MKKLILSLGVLVLSVSVFAQKKLAEVAKIDNETINMGQIKQGSPVPAKFIVTNIGTEPLIIEQASPTCGCTISDYTKEPIMPGKSGYINATYNAANPGHFDKHLTVKFAGVDEIKTITLSGEVVAAADPAMVNGNANDVKAVADVPATVTPTIAVSTPVKKATAKPTVVKAKKPAVKKPAKKVVTAPATVKS